MLNDIDAVLDHAKTVVIGIKDPEFQSILERLRDDQLLVDFMRISDGRSKRVNYDGIC